TIFQLPVFEVTQQRGKLADPTQPRRRDEAGLTLVQTLHDLRAHGVRSIAAHPHASGKTLTLANLAGDCCLIFGSEGHGISPAVLAACDEAVAIPMANGVDSLNVGAAAAVFFYEAQRQRAKT
ncbi:MAG: RNA methyltransferase, partial [Verrucomicrobia bacterium]|nr:RNA methyltransferase [Verrucomicrobiota bacterium]